VTAKPPQQPDTSKARQQVMTGVMLVMGACVFGGLTAVVLMALGVRSGAMIVAAIAVMVMAIGAFIQVSGMRKIREENRAQEKPK
jgi:ABC-type nickel/cobalt efflux system permease component RcnA